LEGEYLGEDLEQGEEGEDLVLGDLEKGRSLKCPSRRRNGEGERGGEGEVRERGAGRARGGFS
jgi:hypothetical protein